MMKLQDKKVNS